MEHLTRNRKERRPHAGNGTAGALRPTDRVHGEQMQRS